MPAARGPRVITLHERRLLRENCNTMSKRARSGADDTTTNNKMSQLPPEEAQPRAPQTGWQPCVYLASGLGFSARERALVLPELVAAIEAAGAKVFEPFTDNKEGAKSADEQGAGWAYRIGQADCEAVRRCDAVFCCANMNPPDEGAMVELGMAIGLRKPTFLYRDDFRTCCKTEDYPLNLMLFTGMPQEGWKDYYYTSPEEICAPAKAFARWVKGEDVRPPALIGSSGGSKG